MISHVKGLLAAIEEDAIVAEAGRVDLVIRVLVSLFSELSGIGKEVAVYIYSQVREDAMTLYGFLHSQGRDVSRQLLGVNGIGPEGVLGVLSVPRPDDLRLVIVSEDAKTLARASDIGNKMARCLILDLKDRISVDDVLRNMAGRTGMDATDTGASVVGLVRATKEAVRVLVTPGYTSTGTSRAVKQVEVMDGMTSEDVLRVSLKHLSFLQGFQQR